MDGLAFDVETDGLLREKDGRPAATRVHCLVTQDLRSGAVRRYWDDDIGRGNDGPLKEGVRALVDASLLVAQNGVGFDIMVVRRFFGVDLWGPGFRDTLVMSHLLHPRIGDIDRKNPHFPRDLIGRHSLEAWGWRLGTHKDDYGKTEHAFDALTGDLVDYCERDVAITAALYAFLVRALEKRGVA